MRTLELLIALVLAAFGVRSIAYWARRRFDARDISDHLLFALYLTGRAGLWFALAGAFLIFGSIDAEGRAFADEAADYRWYLTVILSLGLLQLASGYLLGRRSTPGSADGSDDVA
jgi:hypothetical protein